MEACLYLRTIFKTEKFDIAIVLGTGFAKIAPSLFESSQTVLQSEVPHFPICTAPGHGKEILYGEIGGKGVIVFPGRIHCYEGYRTQYQNFIGYFAALLGCQLLISTNNCG